jgi:hypothetical protein
LWGIALWLSWGGSCPNSAHTTGGLEKGISVWPPAAQCPTSHGGTFWHEALPWATWLIGALVLVGAAVLLTGLVVSIRDLRRPAPAAESMGLRQVEPAPPYGDGPDGHRAAWQEAEAEEDDGRAVAA